MRAAFAAPPDSQKHPGVIVIHEIFGLNDDIRRITGRVADLGYAALAPDLYDREGMRLICIARTLLTLNRGEGDAFHDLDAARKFLQQQPGVDPARIGRPPSAGKVMSLVVIDWPHIVQNLWFELALSVYSAGEFVASAISFSRPRLTAE